jgi:LPS-assembly lipoprotein
MSSSDRTSAPALAGLARVGLLGLGLLALAGCADGGIRPLYGRIGGGSSADALRHIDVSSSGRIGQLIANELDFNFYGGAGQPDKPIRWRLEIVPNNTEVAVGLDRHANMPTAYIEQVSVTYVLTEIGTGRTVTSGTSFANASYDYTSQRFADVRAQRDAVNRAAGVVASDIRTKMAVWFAEHPER